MKRGGSLSFLVGTISNVLVMEIGWTDVGSGEYIVVSCAHSNTSSVLFWIIQRRFINPSKLIISPDLHSVNHSLRLIDFCIHLISVYKFYYIHGTNSRNNHLILHLPKSANRTIKKHVCIKNVFHLFSCLHFI